MDEPIGGFIQQIVAATNGGSGGACLFTLDENGALSYTSQASAGGAWQAWQGPKFAAQPAAGTAIACAGQNNGCLMLAMLDEQFKMWTLTQSAPNGAWDSWTPPPIGSQIVSFTALAAGQQSGPRGIQLVSVDDDGYLWTCYQMDPGSAWSGWTDAMQNGAPAMVGEVALAGQNNGCLILFAETEGLVSTFPQTQPGGAWGSWSSDGMDAGTNLTNICASQQGGTRGVQFWGLNSSSQVWTVFQDTAGGQWDPWQGPGFGSQPETFVNLAAADQNNGCTMLFGVGESGDLWSIGQTAPGGDWGSWSQMTGPSG